MRRHLPLFVSVLVLGAFLPGCALLKGLFNRAFQKPTFRFKTVNLRDASLTGANLDTVWTLENPNAVGLSLAELDYAFFVEDKQVVAGAPRRGLQIPADGKTDLTFPANVKFQDLAPALAVFLNKDQARYKAQGHVGVKTPIGVIKFPLSKEGTFEVPKVPKLEFEAPRIKSLSITGATVEVPLKVTNRNSFPLPVAGIVGNLAIGNANVGNVNTGNLGLLQGGGTQTVTLPVTVNFASALQAANAIRQGRGNVALTGNLQSGGASLPISLTELENFIR